MSVPISIETIIIDGTPQSVTPLIFSIQSKCIERENVSSSYAIIPGYATAQCSEDVSNPGSFLDTRTISIQAYVQDAPRITGNFEDVVISAECTATAPANYSEAQALAEAALPVVESDGDLTQTVARVAKTISVYVEDLSAPFTFTPKLDTLFVTAVSVGTGNTEKTTEPLRFTANVDKYYSPDEVAFDERLEDVSITATVTGVYTKEPLKPKTIEAYSGQSPDDESLSKVGSTQGFFWG